jgi:predicted nucleotidyltransferase
VVGPNDEEISNVKGLWWIVCFVADLINGLCYGGSAMERLQPYDPILVRFRTAVTEMFGDRVERVVLYGSRARGDYRQDSDYDVALFLRDMPDRAAEMGRLAEVETDILYDTGHVINALPFPAGAYQERTGFMHEVRRDGLDL